MMIDQPRAIVLRSLHSPVDPPALYARLRETGPCAWFEVGRRWVVLARLHDGAADDREWRRRVRGTASPAPPDGEAPPLVRGWAGWFGYEAGGWMERQPAPRGPRPLPDAWLGRVRGVAARDRLRDRWVLAGDEAEVEALARLAEGARPMAPPPPPGGRRVPHDDRRAYEAGVRTVLAHLHAGDCYQVNLARRVEVDAPGDALDLWRRLQARNPSRRGALVETPAGAVVSNSPELLLAIRGRRALSVPIKGTAPRSAPPRELLRSPKERSELRMIVDLVRADLGRVAEPGTVRWGPRRVGPVGHVWHAMQRVEATLEAACDAADAFAAVFPAGSVTGAPRIRAMEVIHALEPVPRGVYCGSVGFFDDRGGAWWNVAIRTVSIAGGRASLHVGAGLVVGSRPDREYAETELKAVRLLEAVAA